MPRASICHAGRVFVGGARQESQVPDVARLRTGRARSTPAVSRPDCPVTSGRLTAPMVRRLTRDGLRCEDLMALTFPPDAFDLVDDLRRVRARPASVRRFRRGLPSPATGGAHVFSIPVQAPMRRGPSARVDTSAEKSMRSSSNLVTTSVPATAGTSSTTTSAKIPRATRRDRLRHRDRAVRSTRRRSVEAPYLLLTQALGGVDLRGGPVAVGELRVGRARRSARPPRAARRGCPARRCARRRPRGWRRRRGPSTGGGR